MYACDMPAVTRVFDVDSLQNKYWCGGGGICLIWFFDSSFFVFVFECRICWSTVSTKSWTLEAWHPNASNLLFKQKNVYKLLRKIFKAPMIWLWWHYYLCIVQLIFKCDSNVILLYLFTFFIIWSTNNNNNEKRKTSVCFSICAKSLWLKIINFTYTHNLFLLLEPKHFWLFCAMRNNKHKNKAVYFFLLSCVISTQSPNTRQICTYQAKKPFVTRQQIYEKFLYGFQYFFLPQIFNSHSSYSIILLREHE